MLRKATGQFRDWTTVVCVSERYIRESFLEGFATHILAEQNLATTAVEAVTANF